MLPPSDLLPSGTERTDFDNVIVLPGIPHPQSDPENRADDAEGPAFETAELAPPPPALRRMVVEALLLVTDSPMTLEQLDEALAHPGHPEIRETLAEIGDRYRDPQSGIRLVNVSNGWQLRTDVRAAPWIHALRGGKPQRLTRAALEALSVVAYCQPATKAEVEELRGVDSGGVLRSLCERGLLRVSGRRQDKPGKPHEFRTTDRFLEIFSLRDLAELPELRDLRELQRDDPRSNPGSSDAAHWSQQEIPWSSAHGTLRIPPDDTDVN